MYSIPYKNCIPYKNYFGETQHNLEKESMKTNYQSKQITIDMPFSSIFSMPPKSNTYTAKNSKD